MAIHQDVKLELPLRPECKAIGGGPGIAPRGLGRLARLRREQRLDRRADNGGLRFRIEVRQIGEMAIDEAGVEAACARNSG